jgi:DNA-binding beta-propeller fold protein YncE
MTTLTRMTPEAEKSAHPYIYVVSADGTAVVDPVTWKLIVIAPGVAPGMQSLFMDNHYRDQFGRLWSETQATEDGSALATVYVTDPTTFRNEKTISLGQNVTQTLGLTPDGRFAVVPVSTEDQVRVYDTKSFEEVATIGVGAHPWDMMVSADGKYCCVPAQDSDWLTIIDPRTWTVIGKVETGQGTGPFMVTIWPDNRTASVECSGYHGGVYNHALGPPAVATGEGFAIKYVDLTTQSVIKTIPLDFLAVWDEFTADKRYDFVFGPLAAKTVVVDPGTLEVVKTIELESSPTNAGYLTPDPTGDYVYASLESGLQVIDTKSLQVVETIRIGGVVGTPLVLEVGPRVGAPRSARVPCRPELPSTSRRAPGG